MRKHIYKIYISILFLLHTNVYAQSTIFFDVDEKSITTQENNYLDILRSEESYKRIKIVKLKNTDFINEDKIRLSLFNELSYDFTLTKKIGLDSLTMRMIGNMDNSGNISLILRNNNLTGTIQIENRQFSVIPLGNKIHAIIEIDYSKLKPEESPIEVKENKTLPKSNSIQSTGSIIDILVAYTPAANNAVADIDGLIENAIISANSSFIGDDIDLEYNLVLITELTGYAEGTKTMETILNEFRSNSIISVCIGSAGLGVFKAKL